MLPSTEIESNTENPIEIESNIILAHSSTRSLSAMSMENLSIVLNAALYRQDNRYSSFFCKEWFYLYQKFRQMFS